jgi:hypothetical protein
MRVPGQRPRLPDWTERLAELVEERRQAPFAWGSQDCCLFAADAVVAVTGGDPAAAWRGKYRTEAGAERLLGALGLEGTVAQALADFGLQECPPAFAQRGDLAIVASGNLPTVGVVLGDAVAAPGPDGLAFVPLTSASRAWGV